MADVTRHGEISLFGNFYPIVGKVKQNLASQWAQKQVVGDYSKDSERVVSSWVIDDQTGGMGVKEMDETKHATRFFMSGLNTEYPGHLFMPLGVAQAEEDPGAAESLFLIGFNNLQYVVWSTLLVEVWNNTTSAFDSVGGGAHSLAATPTDAIVHKGKLYFAYGTDFERYDGTNWSTGTALSGVACLARYFIEWDDKLFYVTNAGALFWSADEGVTWTANATSVMAAGSFTSLFKYRDGTGAEVIYLGTTTGIKMLDYDSAQWQDTELNFPANTNACKGACEWRGSAYIPVGLTVYQYTMKGTTADIVPMGPGDTDYGLDSDHQGSIVKLLPELNQLFAVVRRNASPKYSQILRFNGKGWATLFGDLTLGTPVSDSMQAISIGITNSLYRIWFYFNSAVYYANLPSDIYNALELPLATYPLGNQPTNHITPWFDGNNATLNKTALRSTMEAVLKKDVTTGNQNLIAIYYGLNHDDSTWTLLATIVNATTGQATVVTTTPFGSSAGLTFKAIRFKFQFQSSALASPQASPDMHFHRLEYLKNLEVQYGFELVVDASRDYRHKRASTLVANLEAAIATQTLGVFAYRTFQETSTTHYVRITNMQAVTEAGRLKDGFYKLSLVAV